HVKARLEIAGLQATPQKMKEEARKTESSEVKEETSKTVEKTRPTETVEELIQEEEEILEVASEKKDEAVEQVAPEDRQEAEEIVAREDIEEVVQEETEAAVEAQAVHIGHTEEEGDESEHTMFLRQLFVDEEDENERVTLYITQSQDTIETVATRYEISTYQLMKDNDLTEDLLEEGQILKIR